MVLSKLLPKVQDADLKGKIILVRVDHNVVKNGLIHDPYRIDATIGTLYHINAKGGKIILMTHVGRPLDKKTQEICIDEKTSIKPIVDYLQNKLHKHGTSGYLGVETSINHLIKDLKAGIIDGIYLPNTRWFAGEEAKGESADRFAHQLAGLADIFVNDAFGSWQPHVSTIGVTKYMNLNRIYNDYLILGGVIYNAYLCAKYSFSIKGISADDIKAAEKFVDFSKKFPNKIIELPIIVESDTLAGKFKGQFRKHDIRKLHKGQKLNYILDIAQESFTELEVQEVFLKANTIFVNAVMGLVPHFNAGTIALDELIDQNRNAVKLYGGGDTMQELKRLLPGLYIMALDHPKYYIFTGGGAVLKAIESGTPLGLEPIKVLTENKL